MSRKEHSFIPEYPRIRVDRFTESRELIPSYLQPQWRDGFVKSGPWEDLEVADGVYEDEGDDGDVSDCSTSSQGSSNDYTQQEPRSIRRDRPPVMPERFPYPTLHLLTHIHTDHLEGLHVENSVTTPIYCSEGTKEMLLRLEPAKSRKARVRGQQLGTGDRKRPYAWLQFSAEQSAAMMREQGFRKAPHDYLYALPFDTPTEINYIGDEKVRITLLRSNHMSGSAMFLIEGHRGAVVHMGDCRAERWWLDALLRHPVMQAYSFWGNKRVDEGQSFGSLPSHIEATPSHLVPQQDTRRSDTQATSLSSSSSRASRNRKTLPAAASASPQARRTEWGDIRLQRITIDEEWVTCAGQPPGKQDAAQDLVDLIKKFPSDTNFVIDSWTFGYEDIYVAVGKMLLAHPEDGKSGGAKIHVDAYKYEMYEAAADPCCRFLTKEATSTRFHACDLDGQCKHLRDQDLLQHATETEAYESLSQRWHGPAVLPLSQDQIQSVRESAAAKRASQAVPPPLQVLIRIIEASEETWAELHAKTLAEIEKARRHEGPWPVWIACPIQRHTTLPELQQFVRAFRPRNITPQTSDLDKYFLVSKFIGPCLDKDARARLEAEAKEAMGEEEWQKCEEALKVAEGEEPTVARQLEVFRPARRKKVDLSQEVSKQQQLSQRAQQQQQSRGRGGKVGVEGPQPGKAAVAGPSSSSTSEASTSHPLVAPHPASTTILDDDLARRYFIVLRNHVSPGLQFVNLPGGTEGPLAWRAVRIVAPALAITTEHIMLEELGVAPPQWERSPAATPPATANASSAAPSGVSKRRAPAEPSGLRNARGPEEESASASSAQPQKRTKTRANDDEGDEDDDWLQDLLPSSADAPLRLSADLCTHDQARLAAAHATLEEQTASLARILNTATKREDGQRAIARHHRALCDCLIDTLGILGEEQGSGIGGGGVMKPETLLRLVALLDVTLQLVAFVFAATQESRVQLAELKVKQLTISFRECAKGVEALLQGLEGGEQRGVVGGGKGWRAEERAESAVLLKRLQKTLGMVEEEARR